VPALEDISKEELYAKAVLLEAQLFSVQHQLDELKRLVFGQKRERFIAAADTQQGTLFAPPAPINSAPVAVLVCAPAVAKVKESESAKTPSNHKGRNAFPAHLVRVEEILTPKAVIENPNGYSKLGQEVCEKLDYQPAKLFVKRYIRERYLQKPSPTIKPSEDVPSVVLIAPMPERPLPKSIAEAGLLAQIMVDKFVDHLPIDRQAKRWKRESGIDITGSTVVGWIAGVCELLQPLYQELEEQVFDCQYLQADESTIRCLEGADKGKSHQSYQWVYRNVTQNLILFDYQRGRSGLCLHPSVKKHQGYLQTDGYAVYDGLQGLEGLTLLNCWAHVRRDFFEAQTNDPQRAEIALKYIQSLYDVERQCREGYLNPKATQVQRSKKSKPILEEFKVWLDEQYPQVLPKSPIGKAIYYALHRWAKISVYTTNGQLEIDNNQIENAIRPLALGRKNYLFVGSNEAGKRTAMMYSFFATCAAHQINPLIWLTTVLKKIPTHPINQIDQLLPNKWKCEVV
jgi:transposase